MHMGLNHKQNEKDTHYKIELNETPCQISIGGFTYCSGPLELVTYGESGEIQIGRFCSIADNVHIFFGGMHSMDGVSTYPAEKLLEFLPGIPVVRSTFSKGPVVIGNDVWIGEGATILSGVTIGDGAVIGARAVVSRDVPPYSVAVGNPAREVRKRFAKEDIDFLLSIHWWTWNKDSIREFAPYIFDGGDINAFRAAVIRKVNEQ